MATTNQTHIYVLFIAHSCWEFLECKNINYVFSTGESFFPPEAQYVDQVGFEFIEFHLLSPGLKGVPVSLRF